MHVSEISFTILSIKETFMSNKIKAAVIGLGVGLAHSKAYLANPDAELIAICDIDEKRLKERGDLLGIPASQRYTDLEDVLALPELDAVSVALPNYLHAPIAIKAMKAGKHVLSEKPLARSAAEAQSMVDEAARSKKTLMVCFNYRFRDDARWLKGLRDAGKFGDIYYARAGWLRNSGIPGFGTWFTQKDKAGGGPLIDLGVHVLDLTLWLMGYPKVVSVSGAAFSEFGPRGKKTWAWGKPTGDTEFTVEDLATGFVRFENGAVLSLETSWGSHTKPGRDDYFVTLYGKEGGSELYVANYTDRETVSFYTEEAGFPVQLRPNPVMRGGGHELAVAHFVECLKEGRAPEATGEQGTALVRLIEGLYESSRCGREISL
jgi:predicted dehydrogenase